ncbi:MAG: cell division protein FtsL [Proteobacteria bacterium]|nr:cell division protein FtsL [Pseudomonadota bacterium]
MAALRGGLRDFFFALVIMLLAGSAVFVTIWRRVAFINVGYEVTQLEELESRYLHLQKELEIEKAMLESPERIEKIARGRLGLTDPEQGQIRKLP